MHDRPTRERIASLCGPAAAIAAPRVVEWVRPASVVDLGCNVGVWLRAFMELGVADVRGYDQPSVDRSRLLIPEDRFVPADLGDPLPIDRTFDLAVCLEVAEHVPLHASELLLDELVALAPVVLFAAGVPGQGGDGHVNEQWGSWWAERFARRGFERYDVLRHELWDAPGVQWWYAQNIAVYARRDSPATEALRAAERPLPVDVVHPALFEEAGQRPPTVPELLRALPPAVTASARHHLHRLRPSPRH
jgi:SAM-dependent methyltransferase